MCTVKYKPNIKMHVTFKIHSEIMLIILKLSIYSVFHYNLEILKGTTHIVKGNGCSMKVIDHA